jgi:hypothetical protein
VKPVMMAPLGPEQLAVAPHDVVLAAPQFGAGAGVAGRGGEGHPVAGVAERIG